MLGTSAVGAMSNSQFQTYVNDAYQAVFDMANRGKLSDPVPFDATKTPYSYFNATVGLMTMLFMTGDFINFGP